MPTCDEVLTRNTTPIPIVQHELSCFPPHVNISIKETKQGGHE